MLRLSLILEASLEEYIECNDVDYSRVASWSTKAVPEVRDASMNCFPHRVGLSLAQTRNVLKRIIECLRTSNIMYTYTSISVQTYK